jgi:hypothetical protein
MLRKTTITAMVAAAMIGTASADVDAQSERSFGQSALDLCRAGADVDISTQRNQASN